MTLSNQMSHYKSKSIRSILNFKQKLLGDPPNASGSYEGNIFLNKSLVVKVFLDAMHFPWQWDTDFHENSLITCNSHDGKYPFK